MNILLVADVSVANVIGGAERVLYEESTRLVRRGHTVRVLTRKLPDHEADVEQIDGVEEYRYSFQEKLFPFFFKSIMSDCRKTFRSLEENFPFDIINFHQPFSAIGVLSVAGSRRVPCVYTCHSLSFEEYVSRSSSPGNPINWLLHRFQISARKSIEQKVLKKSDQIVVLSEYTRKKLERTYGLSSSKVNVIPGGADLERFRPSTEKAEIRSRMGLPEDKFILFTVRNLVTRMGLENLISAFEIVQNGRSDLLLIIGGEGPLEPALKEQTKRCGVEDFVQFAGYIPDQDLPAYYQMADLFILPTTELEGFGLVTVEALASGLPVLATPVGGTREILSKLGSDYLFSDSTPQSIANGILNALNNWGKDSSAYKAISKSCRQVAEEHYSWDNHVRKLEDLFYSILN
ncbi:MAG: glycosyltransferase family 4 protein [Syntrophobacterales bacterium]